MISTIVVFKQRHSSNSVAVISCHVSVYYGKWITYLPRATSTDNTHIAATEDALLINAISGVILTVCIFEKVITHTIQ